MKFAQGLDLIERVAADAPFVETAGSQIEDAVRASH
jgi:hypothetical protein